MEVALKLALFLQLSAALARYLLGGNSKGSELTWQTSWRSCWACKVRFLGLCMRLRWDKLALARD